MSDFGESTQLAPGQVSITTARRGMLAYMPAEVLCESKVSSATDIYSFGVLLWEVWTRKVIETVSTTIAMSALLPGP